MLKPLNDRVLIERDKAAGATEGGIILPDIAKKRTKQGRVLAVGPGKLDPKTGDRTPLEVKEGDRVLFSAYAGEEVEHEGKTFLFLKEAEVMGTL